MADTNEYTDVVSAVLNQPAPQPNVHAGLALAADANPDFEAELHRLSAKTGVPLETARNATADVKRQAFLQDANPVLLQSQYPAVAGFLSDPTNASVAKDDIDNLSLFETIINGVKRGWQGLKQTGPTTALNANARIIGDIERVQARIAAGEKPDSIPDSEDPYAVRYMTPEQIDEFKKTSKQLIGGQAVDIAVGEFEKRRIPQPAIVGRVQEASKQGWKSAISTFMEDPVRFVASVGSESAVQNAPSLAATFGLGLAGAPGAAVAVTGAGSFVTDYTSSLLEQLQKEGVDIANKDALIAAAQNPALMEKVGRSAYAHATVVSALDAVSGGAAGKLALPKSIASRPAANYAARAVIEPNVQGALGALGEAGGELAQGEKLDPFNIIAEYVGEFAQTPGEHGGAAARKVYSEIQSARQAKQNVEIMQSLGDAASNSKLLNRLPEKLREFIAKAKEGGPVENVYIPAETFATYFQSAGVNPRDVAAELGIKDYSEALAAGADVAIPLEDYVAHLAGTEHHKALIGDMRLHPGDMTLREAEAFEKNRDEVIKRFMEHTQQQEDGAPAVYNQIKNDLLGQLLGRYDRKTAESYATLYAKGITTLAERSGVDPLALHEKYGLSVKSPLPDILTKAASTDINIDPLLDRLRAGDIPSVRDVHGESLTEFVRRMGGLKDEGGDVKAMDADKGKRPFQRNMIQPITGLSYDYMREAAAEAGFFSHDVSEADFLSMLDDEIQGLQSTYAERNQDQQLLGLREMLEQIDRALQDLGIDINNVTNEQVRAALDAAAQMAEGVAQQYDQALLDNDTIEIDGVKRSTKNSEGKPISYTTAALRDFWKWFGDSKVVDEQGRPLVVYHGTTTDFDSFAPSSHFGTLAQANDILSYAQRKAEGSQKILAVYLSIENPKRVDDVKNWSSEVDRAKAEGHDGLVYANWGEFDPDQNGNPRDSYVAFNPTQIKSVDNIGTWRGDDARIMYQNGGMDFKVKPPKKLYRGIARGLQEDGSDGLGTFMLGKGLYSSPSKKFAAQYGDVIEVTAEEAFPRNPLVLTARPGASAPDTFRDWLIREKGFKNMREFNAQYPDPGTYVRSLGFDGVFIGDEVVRYPADGSGMVADGNSADMGSNFRADGSGLLSQQNDHSDKRGYIQFGNDRKFSITLLEKADLSTFLHETGHFWLEVMGDLAEASDVSPQIEQDYATLLKWFGVENRSQITVEHHEQFARGFEGYLMEGNAPSAELRSIFRAFRAWLKDLVYRLVKLDYKINDDIRGVFDRILATDAEIEDARQTAGMMQLFATAADMGVSNSEFDAYAKATRDSIDEGREDLQAKLIAEFKRRNETWYKARRAEVQQEVADEIARQPVYLAFDGLTAGHLADGSMPGLKLNKVELVERYGAEFVKRLPTGGVPGRKGNFAVHTTEGGVSAEVAAELFGFNSADEMVAALVDMKPRKELIKAETEARMDALFGNMLRDGALHDEAVAALHNEKRAEVMAVELRALRRKQREVAPIVNAMKRDDAQQRNAAIDSIPPVSAIRDMAAGMIGQKQVRDLQPNTYLLAERKASRQAFEAAAKGDYQAAAVAKQRELLNHYLYREAIKAQEDVDSVVAYAKQLGKTPAQQRIGKAGADYLKQINDLLEQYEFKPVSGSQLDRRRNLLAWYNAQVAAGFNPAITPELLENAGQRNYKEVPVDELRALKDALKSIESLATLKNQLLGKNSAVEYTTAVENLVEAAEKNVAGGNAPSTFKSQRGAFTVAGDWASKVGAELLQIEAAIDVLDGGRADGPWHQYIFNRASDAQTAFIETMADIGAKVNALVEEHAKSGKMDDRFTTPLSSKPITRYELISIALNVGNQQNYDKLLRGMGWTAADVDAALSRLSAADWEFVQKTWDTINELWPQIAALEKRISGVEPEKIEARSYQIRDEAGNVTHEVKGGYYPLAYDPAHSNAGLKQESGPLAGLTEAGYAPATSPRGHTKARTEGFAAPLLLDFGQVLQKHLSGVVKDLTHREFLIDANRLFNDQRVRAVLQDTLGAEYEKQFMPWLKGIANDGNGENVGPLGKMFEHARASTTTVALGFKVATIVSQAAGIVNAMEYVGSGWIAKGLRQAMASGPLYAFRGEALDKVLSKSGEMRHRFDTLDRDVRDRLRDINAGKAAKGTKAIQRAAFAGIGYADRMVAIPTWLGAYEKALSQGMDEETAIHAADGAVRRSQGAGAAKDLSQIQRRGGAMKLFTMFMTPFGAAFGRLYNAKKGLDTNGMKYAPEAIMRVLMVTAIPAVIADLLAARGPDQCELGDVACYGKWAALKSVFSVTTTVPVLREMGNFAENYLSGKTNSRDIKLSPILDTFNKVEKSAQHTLESVFGDRPFEEKDFFDLMENSGYIANLPTAQARITIEYLYDLLSGNRNPQGPGELLHDLAFRRKENK